MDQGSSLFAAGGRSELLDVISRVKSNLYDALGVLDFPIPQFILIGKQSVGKSRLIEALAGETFNFISGTLGSRRPTVLEFRNVSEYTESRWLIFNRESDNWEARPTSEVMRYLGEMHESLGLSVSDIAVNVRIESAHCCDMQIIDLPGFRDFAMDDEKQKLAEKIQSLVTGFMEDKKNVMLCVEEAGDAANLSTLTKCKKYDPKFERTILIRNKLDKYYRDLTSENVGEWLKGFGDLPDKLPRFALTLPNWKDGEHPPKPFVEMRADADTQDIAQIKAKGGEKMISTIGYSNFANYVGNKLERMFAEAIVPVMNKVADLKEKIELEKQTLEDVIDYSNPRILENNVREAGMSFGRSLQHVMEGFISSEANRITLLEELQEFHEHHNMLGSSFPLLPSDDFSCLEDYCQTLEHEIHLPSVNVEVNGGAQFRRMMAEVEIFCRFAELTLETKEVDVIQAKGVGVHDITWSDVVKKLLISEAHQPMRTKIKYVAERIAFFFKSQKPVCLDFMFKIIGTSEEKMFSALFPKYAAAIHANEFVRHMIYECFDRAVERQKDQFLTLFYNTLTSVFANPWVFLKKASAEVTGDELDDLTLPTFEDSKKRVPQEIDARLGIENILQRWLAKIPTEMTKIEIAVDMGQMLLLKTFQFIRCNISDQIDLYAESFFKLPMLRRLEEDMRAIELSDTQMELQQEKTADLAQEFATIEKKLKTLESCDATLRAYVGKIKRTRREEI